MSEQPITTEHGKTIEPMTKVQFLETMRTDRARWEAAISALQAAGAERLEAPGVAGTWSARDVIAHITAYERWMLDALEATARGEEPPPSILDGDDMDERNIAEHERTRDVSLARTRAEARYVWDGLVAAVERTPERTLVEVEAAPGFVSRRWGRDTALWEAIWGLSGEHYDEHLPDFAAAITAATLGSQSA